ncbi:MAG TPA: hypothetical protein VMS76_07620 [Planctomycetota bacterium]|nr:hypothetical protein [Planctomycetota bacterium]
MKPTRRKPTHGHATSGGQRRDEPRAPSHYTCARCGERCCADDDGWVEMFGCLCILCLKELESPAGARSGASPPAPKPLPRGEAGAQRRDLPKRRRA